MLLPRRLSLILRLCELPSVSGVSGWRSVRFATTTVSEPAESQEDALDKPRWVRRGRRWRQVGEGEASEAPEEKAPSEYLRALQDDPRVARQRSLDIAIIGAPNVGKSALTNALVRAPVSAVSRHIDTTRTRITTAWTQGDFQLVALDTPGTVGRAHVRQECGLDPSKGEGRVLISAIDAAMERAEHVIVVAEATAPGDYLHHRLLHVLHRHAHLTSTLVINKVDLVPNRSDLLALTFVLTEGRVAGKPIPIKPASYGSFDRKQVSIVTSTKSKQPAKEDELRLHDDADLIGDGDEEWIRMYRQLINRPAESAGYGESRKVFANRRGWPRFDAVFFCSALEGDGVDALRDHLTGLTRKRPHRFAPDLLTTQNAQRLAVESTRSAILDTMPASIGHKIKINVNEWVVNGEVLSIIMDVTCPTKGGARMLFKAGRVFDIAKRVDEHLAALFQRQLHAKIVVKVDGKIVDPSTL